MNTFLLANSCYSPLFSDTDVVNEFSTETTITRFVDFEIALTKALGNAGLIAPNTAKLAIKKMQSFVPDIDAIGQASLKDGLPVPAFVRQLKAHTGAYADAVHIGTTSQDLIDTATILALRNINVIYTARITQIIDMLHDLISAYGARPMMGRTRMQAALPITVADRIKTWVMPLEGHQKRLQALQPTLEQIQFGGPVGDCAAFAGKGAIIAADMAKSFDLNCPDKAWHTMRETIAEYANWLSLVTGSLGKMGQDLCLMAQQGVDEVTFKGGGGSSAMPHKQNPVLAEMLVVFARYNAVQLSGMHHALVHEQERSGIAWTLEWMFLPAMVGTTGKALELTETLLGQITHIGKP